MLSALAVIAQQPSLLREIIISDQVCILFCIFLLCLFQSHSTLACSPPSHSMPPSHSTLVCSTISYLHPIPHCRLIYVLFLLPTCPLTSFNPTLPWVVTTQYCPEGIYQLRLCIDGEWTIVNVDDSFPCHSDGRLVFSKVSYTTGAGYAAPVAVFEDSLRSREPDIAPLLAIVTHHHLASFN